MVAPGSRPGEARRYWFAAKRYGWGWGPPLTWEGWLTLALYVLGLVLAAVLAAMRGDERVFTFGVPVLTLLLIAVFQLKGEPPRWRWGGER